MGLVEDKPSEFIRLIEEDNSIVQVTDSDGLTIFRVAVYYGRFQVMEAINNIDPHMKDRGDKDNRTPLMFASYNEQAFCVEWLLDHDADVDIKDIDGNTVLDWRINEEIKDMIKEK